jgi:hypothetical protein
MAPKQKKEDKRVRSLVLGVRLAPKLRYAVELAARKQRRSASSFAEWAMEDAVKRLPLRITAIWVEEDATKGVWVPDEIPVGECLKYVRELRMGKAKITKKSVHEVVEEIWHPEESCRFAQLAMSYPELLTYEEQVLWAHIEGTPQLWSSDKGGNKKLNFAQLKKHWDQLKQTAGDIK